MKESKPKIVPPVAAAVVPTQVLQNAPQRIERFYRPKRVGGYINLYVVEQITVEDDVITERKVITERDNRDITMSKIMIKLEEGLK